MDKKKRRKEKLVESRPRHSCLITKYFSNRPSFWLQNIYQIIYKSLQSYVHPDLNAKETKTSNRFILAEIIKLKGEVDIFRKIMVFNFLKSNQLL